MTDKNFKIIKVENKLQKKAGFGEISEAAIKRSEGIILSNEVDFREIATPILHRLREAIQHARQNPSGTTHLSEDIIKPVMELKANGAMFKYELVGHLATVMLSFLEHILQCDADALEIIDAHEKTLTLIVTRQIKGNGGQMGKQLTEELESACARYYRKNPDKFKQPPQKKA